MCALEELWFFDRNMLCFVVLLMILHRVSEQYSYLTAMRVVRRSNTDNCQIIYELVILEGKLAEHIENL